jgi:hypothetical protein
MAEINKIEKNKYKESMKQKADSLKNNKIDKPQQI